MTQDAVEPSRYVVVAGIDFSHASELALDEASTLAGQALNGSLHVVHVVPFSLGEPPIGAGSVPELAYMDQIHRATEVLARWIEPHQARCSRVHAHVRIGRPDREIAQLASDLGANLVVVGTHGRQGFERLMLGSVAEGLVRHAPCPVLVYRPRAAPVWEQIEPPCPDCVAVQRESAMDQLWCPRHAERHPRAHTYHEVPAAFGVGAQTFRF
jgi:nucleotide-binding universal stress UspA family protein